MLVNKALRRGASTARNLIALIALIAIVGAIVFVLNRPKPQAVIVSKDLAPLMPGSALAGQYPLNSMLFTGEFRNDGAAADFDVVVDVHSADQTWTERTTISLDEGESEQVVLDFGPLDGIRDDLEYEIRVTAR